MRSLGLQPSVVAKAVLDLVFPRQCVCCNGLVYNETMEYLCTECFRRIFWIKPPGCQTCGSPFYGIVEGKHCCQHCQELEPAFESGHSIFFSKGLGRKFIHAFKYHHGLYLLKDIQRLLEKQNDLQGFFKGAVLVPVPLHPRKKRERGFNQSLLLARCLSAVYSDLTIQEILLRVVDTPSQTGLSRTRRQRNLSKAFILKKETILQQHKKYIVVDDVFTTGATLNACCRVLRQAGLRNLHVFTLCHG